MNYGRTVTCRDVDDLGTASTSQAVIRPQATDIAAGRIPRHDHKSSPDTKRVSHKIMETTTALSQRAASEASRRKEEALTKARGIIGSHREAERFFFHEMLPAMAKIATDFNKDYSLALKPDYVCHIAYVACFENDWKKLRGFRGDTTIHNWVATLAKQALDANLHEEGFIRNKTGKYSSSSFAELGIDDSRLDSRFDACEDSLHLDDEPDRLVQLRERLERRFGHREDQFDGNSHVYDLLRQVGRLLDYSESDVDLWMERNLNKTKSADLAEELGHTRAWVDVRNGRIKPVFHKTLTEWWTSGRLPLPRKRRRRS